MVIDVQEFQSRTIAANTTLTIKEYVTRFSIPRAVPVRTLWIAAHLYLSGSTLENAVWRSSCSLVFFRSGQEIARMPMFFGFFDLVTGEKSQTCESVFEIGGAQPPMLFKPVATGFPVQSVSISPLQVRINSDEIGLFVDTIKNIDSVNINRFLVGLRCLSSV
jgi:hypothetical protein